MSEYLLLNIAIIIFPLLLSFESKIAFYKKLPALALSLSIVSTAFIIWDAIATYRGDWGFSREYLMGHYLVGLPIEEILFFVSVPYSIIFLYETLILYVPDKKVFVPKYVFIAVIIVLILSAVLFSSQYYTYTVLLFSAGFLILALIVRSPLLYSRNYYIFLAATYIPFLVVNYILTAPPIVYYSDKAIWGVRFITIPMEDFFYSFSMISFWLYFYMFFKKKLGL